MWYVVIVCVYVLFIVYSVSEYCVLVEVVGVVCLICLSGWIKVFCNVVM